MVKPKNNEFKKGLDMDYTMYQKSIDEYDYNYCYECQGYGDDYYEDENGDLVSACDDCVHNEFNWEDGYWKDDI